MVGIVTREPEELGWPEFDRGHYEVKAASGRHAEPVAGATSAVSCFADSATVGAAPGRAAVGPDGDRATGDGAGAEWGYVCPLDEAYRDGLFELVEACVEASPDLRLDDVGLPGAGFCACERCEEAFAESDHDDREAWRASVVTSFVADVADRVPGRLHLSVYPDPYPGHLRRRAGVDPGVLAAHVDEFVVPLYDTAYGTTYWLEVIAGGFADALDAPVAVELFAGDVGVEALVDAVEAVDTVADEVFLAYGGGNARAAVRRMRADDAAGREHRPG